VSHCEIYKYVQSIGNQSILILLMYYNYRLMHCRPIALNNHDDYDDDHH